MNDIKLHNIHILLKLVKNRKQACKLVDITEAQMSRMINNPDKYPISDTMAERFERAFDKPEGWMSVDRREHSHASDMVISDEKAIEVIQGLNAIYRERGKNLSEVPDDRLADILRAAFNSFRNASEGSISDHVADALIDVTVRTSLL